MAAETFNDSKGDVIGYKFTEDERVKFQVERAEDKNRLSRIESHLEDIKNRMNKTDDKLASLFPMLHDLLGTWTSVCKRLEDAEKVTKPINALGIIIKKPIMIILGVITAIVSVYYAITGY